MSVPTRKASTRTMTMIAFSMARAPLLLGREVFQPRSHDRNVRLEG
jgi:hypothetical protein